MQLPILCQFAPVREAQPYILTTVQPVIRVMVGGIQVILVARAVVLVITGQVFAHRMVWWAGLAVAA